MQKRRITIRLGPLGLSLLAAGITAVGVAAVSLADSGNGGGVSRNNPGSVETRPAPPGGGPVTFFREDLSAADRQKLEDFRKCMQDNGAPAPPDREQIEKAYGSCKDRLPEQLQNEGPPGSGAFHCGPPPGSPPVQARPGA